MMATRFMIRSGSRRALTQRDQIGLVAHVRGCSQYDAAALLDEHFNIESGQQDDSDIHFPEC